MYRLPPGACYFLTRLHVQEGVLRIFAGNSSQSWRPSAPTVSSRGRGSPRKRCRCRVTAFPSPKPHSPRHISEGTPPTVDGHCRSGHEGHLITRQEKDRPRNLFWFCGPFLRNGRDEAPVVFFVAEPRRLRVSIEHRGLHVTRADRIRANPVFRVVDRKDAGEEDHPALRGTVGGRQGRRDKA